MLICGKIIRVVKVLVNNVAYRLVKHHKIDDGVLDIDRIVDCGRGFEAIYFR